jgi:hypothetical protein
VRLGCCERCARIGPCDGRLVGHLDLRRELIDEIRVRARIDLALQQF